MIQKVHSTFGFVAALSIFLLSFHQAYAVERWSRQLEPTIGGEQTDSFDDWIPLTQPLDGSSKDRNARVLTYSQAFPPNNRFAAELSKPQPPFDFPFQFPRYSNQPQAPPPRHQLGPNGAPIAAPLKSNGPQAQGQEPTSQSFFKFEMPYHTNPASGGPPTVQTGYQIQHTFGGGAQATLFSSPFYNQQPVFPPEFHPIPQKSVQQQLKQKPLPQQNFIEDTLPLKNVYRESKPSPTQQSLQAVTPQVFPVNPPPEPGFGLSKPTSFQTPTAPGRPQQQQQQPQEVQLLYVPYDALYHQQNPQHQNLHGSPAAQNTAFEVNKFNLNAGLPAVNPYQINQFYTQDPLGPPQDSNYFATSTTSRPLTTSLKPSNVFQSYALPLVSTPRPKPKAHQPPLSMFLLRRNTRPTQSEVVSILRNSNTVSVIDAPTKNTPEIFIGPAGMPTPDGYVKFDLPYLSQLTHTRDLSDVPFFVAPLSYHTQDGFHKILLPEPHVGSIVINQSKLKIDNNSLFNTQNEIGQFLGQSGDQRQRYSGQRVLPSKDFYSESSKATNGVFEITTQRATLSPSRGNKFSYFFDQDQGLQEVTSPKATKHDRPKKKRPQSVQVEQPTLATTITNPYAQFKPIPNQINSDDYYYKLQSNKQQSTSSTSTTSTTSSTSTTTTSTTPEPDNYFTYHPSSGPQVEFQSTNGQVYHSVTKPAATGEEHLPRFTTRPPPANNDLDEEFRMKQYFRQQDAFRNRPHFANPTNSPFEQVHYTPVQFDYDREVTIPSTTDKTTTSTKHRVTYYTPSATPATTALDADSYNTLPPRENIVEYNNVKLNQAAGPDSSVPSNHRPSYNQNEISDGNVEYEPNPYQLPSELPSLSPQLPGLVNNLQEKRKQQQEAEEQATLTTTTAEPEIPTRATRRPLNRIRKPVISKVTSSVSYSESEATSRRPSQRVRRPFGSRGSSMSDDDTLTTTTRRPSSSSSARNPLIRNPNRIRYQPTTEERQTLRIKPKKQYKGSKNPNDAEDLEYQRDVLKQNYPIFKGRKPTSPTAIPSSYAITSTEGSTSETQQIYTVTPSNSLDQNEQNFPANLLESMQIPQQYNDYSKDNYGPGYFPNQEDLSPTEAGLRNEIGPVYTTSTSSTSTTTTTTEEPPSATTRRSPFLRRNYPRPRTTTTEAPATTTQSPEDRPSIRPRIPPRKVIKVRTRTRRPTHPASSTNAPQDQEAREDEEKSNNYRKLSRFNADLYENDTPRRRYKNKFQLEGQESQWSPSLKVNNFKPIHPNEARDEEQEHKFDNEQEIITADPDTDSKKSDTYEINVSAKFGSSDNAGHLKTSMKEPNLKPEKSFAELLEEVMGKAEEVPAVLEPSDDTTGTTEATYFESQKTTVNDRLNRRGKWKKLRTSAKNNESFETAESQNIGTQFYNTLNTAEHGKTISEIIFKTTTPMTTAHTEITTSAATTTPATPQLTVTPATATTQVPMTTVDSDSLADLFSTTTTANSITKQSDLETTTMKMEKQPADSTVIATRRSDQNLPVDDLDTQSSLFSEVKRQLHELFAIDENEDDTAVTAALAAVGRRRQEYTNIKRDRPLTTEVSESSTTTALPKTQQKTNRSTVVPMTEPTKASLKNFHKNLMDNIVYATSTSTKVSSETEICYRGRCIRSDDLPSNHKLN